MRRKALALKFFALTALVSSLLVGCVAAQSATPTPAPVYPDTLNVTPLWQYVYDGNLLGLLNAIYLSAFQLEDIVVGVLLLIGFAPLYIKSRNLLLCAVCWTLLGGAFVAVVPILNGLAVILLALGVSSLLYKLVRPN